MDSAILCVITFSKHFCCLTHAYADGNLSSCLFMIIVIPVNAAILGKSKDHIPKVGCKVHTLRGLTSVQVISHELQGCGGHRA